MSRIKLASIILLMIFTYQLKAQELETVKVISYNIWNGFDWGKDEDRRAKLVTWMNEQAPDIVGLQELCKYSTEKLAADAKGWGHEYSVLLKKSGYSVGLTSKYPIEVVEKIRDNMHHGALHCRTNGLDVFVVHFSPSSYLKRREETEIILEKMKAAAKTNSKLLIMGDFNAHSPFDADLYKNNIVRDRTRENDKDKGEKGNLVNREIDYAVLANFLAFPLIDICQTYSSGIVERGSFPARALSEVNDEKAKELERRMQRIDYILVSEELGKNGFSGKVHNGRANYYLSDHYPVSVEFKMNK